MRIAVFGLGYVGCISAACFAREGHQVIGVDVNADKVDMINAGKSPIVEPGLDEAIQEAIAGGRLRATTDFKDAVLHSDISLVCVGTPSGKNGSVHLDFIFRVAEQIGDALKEANHYHVFVIRSTVLPGTHEKAREIIAERSGKKPGEEFGACSNPEFLREGSALKDFYAPPFTVIGEMDTKSGDYLAEIYKNIDAPLVRTDVKVAELVKYANNVFHAMKVAFGNEMGTICKAEGVDSHKLMEIFCMDHKLNLSPYYLKPGFAFGGSCLPKDVRAITYRAREKDLDLPLLNSLMPSNVSHVQRSIDLVIGQGKKKIGILGLSFKGNTDDLRESPMVDVVETLLGKGYDIRIYDRNVHLAKLFGANKEYINEKIPHISNLMVADIDEAVAHGEVLIIGNHSKEFSEKLKQLPSDKMVIDFVRILKDTSEVSSEYDGLCW
ncbi:MAG: UDP-glucose/GDP-mannose dehydrogenase family protein [Calditrichaeota bacterium]|nr:UDP-glucose/GDP-mannose dehydrogenase family protein [Calditrichota bacterium]MCB0304537.1 UDP-glucose/GDP-mannose dehydrogenase family protein [Calditrichota bacterium]MCB9089420.1 UDP-glucose/GDP-mannose dehydrogenase family protein [Calditrichia bacterium]